METQQLVTCYTRNAPRTGGALGLSWVQFTTPPAWILPGGGEGNRQAEGQEGLVRDQEPAEGGPHPADDPPPKHHAAAGHPGDGEQLLPGDGAVSRREPHEQHLRQEAPGRAGDSEIHPAAGAGRGAPAQGGSGAQVKKKTTTHCSQMLVELMQTKHSHNKMFDLIMGGKKKTHELFPNQISDLNF